MRRILYVLCVAVVVPAFLCAPLMAAENGEKKAKPLDFKVKGQLIPHPDKNDVKVLTDSYDTLVVEVDKKTKITATVKTNLQEMAKEDGLPKGEITFEVVDGKLRAKAVNFVSGQSWATKKKKKKD